MELNKYLNPQQIKAVKSTENPLLVIAGAGSGKTRVLTYRIAYLIEEKHIDPFNILAITFTNKAAREMKRRVIELVGRVGEYMWVSTFHSFCARILRNEIHYLGMSGNYVIYDQEDSVSLISKIEKELDFDIKRFPPRSIKAAISDAKNKLIDFETYSKNAADYTQKIIAKIYTLYQENLFKANALDFDDLLVYMVDILKLFPEVKKKYQEKFKYILVDEFQDTNQAQNEIVMILSEGHKKICVVGDDDQSIYSWRGADISNITGFDRKFRNAEVIKLEQNYRSSQNILNAANSIIKNNINRKNKKLWTENPDGEMVSKYVASDEKAEVDYVLRKIKDYTERKENAGKKYKYSDFAIFYRTNAQSRTVEEFLIRHNIPYKIYGGLRFYDRKEIKDMLAYMKLISNPKDIVSLIRIVNVPKRKIGKSTISIIENFARKSNMTFCEAFYRIEEINLLSESVKNRINEFIEQMSDFRSFAVEHNVDELVEQIWKKTGYLRELEEDNTIDSINRIENLRELLTVTREYEERLNVLQDITSAAEMIEMEAVEKSEGEKTGKAFGENDLKKLDGFLEEVSLLTDIDNYDEKSDSVILMTLHNAKGLEYPVVFIIGMEEGIFPHSRSMGSIEELEEERRLCYVGITRAMEKVFLTASKSHSIYGDTSFMTISRFIGEIAEDLIFDENKKMEVAMKSSSSSLNSAIKSSLKRLDKSGYDASTENFEIGDNVEHKMWGPGKVIKIKKLNEDVELDVIFNSVGLKHLLASFAPVKKISRD